MKNPGGFSNYVFLRRKLNRGVDGDSSGKPIPTDADLLNRANLGIQEMYAPNTHNFPKLL